MSVRSGSPPRRDRRRSPGDRRASASPPRRWSPPRRPAPDRRRARGWSRRHPAQTPVAVAQRVAPRSSAAPAGELARPRPDCRRQPRSPSAVHVAVGGQPRLRPRRRPRRTLGRGAYADRQLRPATRAPTGLRWLATASAVPRRTGLVDRRHGRVREPSRTRSRIYKHADGRRRSRSRLGDSAPTSRAPRPRPRAGCRLDRARSSSRSTVTASVRRELQDAAPARPVPAPPQRHRRPVTTGYAAPMRLLVIEGRITGCVHLLRRLLEEASTGRPDRTGLDASTSPRRRRDRGRHPRASGCPTSRVFRGGAAVRSSGSPVSILMLTARDTVGDRVTGLDYRRRRPGQPSPHRGARRPGFGHRAGAVRPSAPRPSCRGPDHPRRDLAAGHAGRRQVDQPQPAPVLPPGVPAAPSRPDAMSRASS